MKGWRTLALNGLLLLVALTDYLAASGALIGQIVGDSRKAGLVVIGLSLLNIVLRFLTSTEVGRKATPSQD